MTFSDFSACNWSKWRRWISTGMECIGLCIIRYLGFGDNFIWVLYYHLQDPIRSRRWKLWVWWVSEKSWRLWDDLNYTVYSKYTRNLTENMRNYGFRDNELSFWSIESFSNFQPLSFSIFSAKCPAGFFFGSYSIWELRGRP